MYKLALTFSATLLTLSACTNSGDPQLSMCQAVAKQLTNNSVSSWDGDSKDSTDRMVTVKVQFTNSADQAGSISCAYPKDENGNVDTAPTTVAMNSQRVDQQTLLSVGTAASKELLAGTYKNTVEKSTELAEQAAEKSKELAEQATVKGKELAGQAADAAAKGAKTLQQLQQQ